MRLEQLEYLVTLAQCGSLNKASQRLFVSQQSIGKALRELERELGVTLLVRGNKGTALTREGEEAVRRGKDILERAEQLRRCFAQEEPLSGKLTILCNPALFASLLPSVLREFAQQHREVELTAMEKDSYYMPELHQQLLQQNQGEVISLPNLPQAEQIGIVRLPANLEFHPLYPNTWVCCMHRYHPLARQERITMETLLKEKLIVSSPDYPEPGLDYAMLSVYGKPQVTKVVSSLELYYRMLEESEEIVGVIPDIMLRQKETAPTQNLVCRTLEPTPRATVGYLVDREQSRQPLIQKFLQHLETILRREW